MSEKRYSVMDLDPGLGGRALAFSEAGFSISALIENDAEKGEICRSNLPNAPIIPAWREFPDLSAIPSADVLLGRLPLAPPASSHRAKQFIEEAMRLTDLIVGKTPKIFLMQAPIMALRRQPIQLFDETILRRYSITYQICSGMRYSGFPVNSRQLFMVGIRADIAEKPFQFPESKYEQPYLTPWLEPADDIDPWYYKLPASAVFPPESGGLYFYRRPGKGIVAAKEIPVSRIPDVYTIDSRGPRRLTHREISWLKGISGFDPNQYPKRIRMYQMLREEPDIYIVKAIAQSIYGYLEGLGAGREPDMWIAPSVDWKPHGNGPEPAGVPKQEKRAAASGPKAAAQKQVQKKPAMPVISKINIKTLQIDHLKGLDNLEISFDKRLTAIMGVNGAGKSTVLHALACMFSPAEQGEDRKFNYFFTPTPDASWQGSRFRLTYFDETTQSAATRLYQKTTNRWSPKYSTRPKRDVFFLGIETGIPEIERERQTSFIDYHTDEMNDRLSGKVRIEAAQILNKDYQYLTRHKTKKKELFGIHTKSNITYSSLSMGAGEQRLIRILTTVHRAPAYSLILIDEIDLLLHSEAQKRLIKVLSDIAGQKKLQIIFTTHSLAIGALTHLVDVRYLFRVENKVSVYDRITPYIVSELQQEREQPLTIYVEDDLAGAIVSFAAEKLNLGRWVKVHDIGSASNAFTVAAGIVLMGGDLADVLVVLDGDVYKTGAEKETMVKKALAGTERDHPDKIALAVSAITQFNLPDGFKPEKYIHSLLVQADGNDEVIDCAKRINAVSEDHEWLNLIIDEINNERSVALHRILEQASKHADWYQYIAPVHDWLLNKQKEHQLYSISRQKMLV